MDAFPALSAIATACGTRTEQVGEGLLQAIQSAMRRYEINTPLRQAHFCAQIGHESQSLYYREEIWGPTPQQQRYDPPTDLAEELGNVQPGDGQRFKGRGLIQLTGRANYMAYNKAVPVNVVQQPELVAEPEFAADVAGWYWDRAGLNEVADKDVGHADGFRRHVAKQITKEINGGFNGLADRIERLKVAKKRLLTEAEYVEPAEVEEIITTDPTDSAHDTA